MSQTRLALPGSKGLSSPYPSVHEECRRTRIYASLLLVALLTLCQGAQGGRKLSRRKYILLTYTQNLILTTEDIVVKHVLFKIKTFALQLEV